MPASFTTCPLRSHVDPRLLRFSAGATAGVLAAALLLADVLRPLALGLLASQVAVFAFTAFVSFHWSVWAQVFARVVWPRLEPPSELRDARPPRFAQGLGLVVTAGSLGCFVAGADVAGYVLAALALVMTAVDAATGWCLGCRAYLLVRGEPAAS